MKGQIFASFKPTDIMDNEVSAMNTDVSEVAFDSVVSELVHQSVAKAERLGQVNAWHRVCVSISEFLSIRHLNLTPPLAPYHHHHHHHHHHYRHH